MALLGSVRVHFQYASHKLTPAILSKRKTEWKMIFRTLLFEPSFPSSKRPLKKNNSKCARKHSNAYPCAIDAFVCIEVDDYVGHNAQCSCPGYINYHFETEKMAKRQITNYNFEARTFDTHLSSIFGWCQNWNGTIIMRLYSQFNEYFMKQWSKTDCSFCTMDEEEKMEKIIHCHAIIIIIIGCGTHSLSRMGKAFDQRSTIRSIVCVFPLIVDILFIIFIRSSYKKCSMG